MTTLIYEDARLICVRSDIEIEEARTLFLEYVVELGVSLDFQNFTEEVRGLPGAYAPPGGDIFLAVASTGESMGCMAFRPHQSEICELKRLYVRPAARRGGLGRKMIEHALALAQARGYQRARLDTLPQMEVPQRLYEEMGFVEIEPYYPRPRTGMRYYERRLGDDLC